MLLPSTEVYAVLRENGFSPLGIPRLRGSVYTIAVIDRRGEDGRLVIDARDGRILRFMPARDAYGMAPGYEQPAVAPYRPQSALPPPTMVRSGPPRPPAPIPHVASRTVPLPKAAPPREAPVAAKPAEPATPASPGGRRAGKARRGRSASCSTNRRSSQIARGGDPADAGDASRARVKLGNAAHHTNGVVLAKARTHTARSVDCAWCEYRMTSLRQTSLPGVTGPGFRQDDDAAGVQQTKKTPRGTGAFSQLGSRRP